MKSVWGRCSILVFASAVACATFAKTVYVDVARPNDAGDGLSWETAKHTIQAAVEAAAAGDTVLVRPGVYDEGYGMPSAEPDFRNRVYINKALTLESTDGAEATHIVGAYDPDTVNTAGLLGNGPKAVRCVTAAQGSGALVVIRGFTLRDGACHPAAAGLSDNKPANGGGFRSYNENDSAWLVDCVVRNCTGIRGGGLRHGRAIRTRLVGNMSPGKGGAACYSQLAFCVIDGNRCPSGGVCVGGTYVNCTVVNNNGCSGLFTESAKVYNTIAVQNDGWMANDASMTFDHVLVDDVRHVDNYDEATVLGASPYQFFAPLTGDYRLLPSAQAIGAASSGNLDRIALPSALKEDRDFAGAAFDRTAPLHAGAIQTPAPEPAGGAVWFTSGNISVDGVPALGKANYLYTETYPTQVLVRPCSTSDRVFTWRHRSYDAKALLLRCPLPDDSLWFLPPVKGRCCTNELLTVQDTLYVDASAAPGGDGSAAKPFNTIQKAVDAVPGSSNVRRTLIQVAAGVYDSDEDLKTVQGMPTRVAFYGGQYIRLLGAGEGRTVIKGRADPTGGPAGDGRGPNAIRCVGASSGLILVQNLTMTDGYVDYVGDGNNGGTDTPATCGGAVFAHNFNDFYVADCTIANSVGYRGALYRGTFARCRITGSAGYGGGMRYSKLMCCVVDDMRNASGGIPLAHGCWANQCTLVGRSVDEEQIYTEDCFTNMVVHTTKWIGSRMKLPGSIVWNFQGAIPATSEAKLGNPQFTRGDGDYIPLATSPVIGAGYFWDGYPDDYSPDRNGNPIRFVDGRPCAGAFHTFRSGYSVELGTPSYGISMTPAGFGELQPGESVTISVDLSQAQRPCTAVAVNGVTSDVTTVTFTAPAAGEPAQGVRVTPLVAPHWYVDPAGSDDANGFTPETAKRTFRGVFATGFVLAWDTVHAAAGRYEEGTMPNTGYGDSVVDARVGVPENVTVVGAGRGRSFIVGAPAPAGAADANGNGAGAVRGVYIRNGGVLKGFTVTGGHTCTTGEWNENNYGGGVLSAGGRGLVVDCDIIENASSRGGGAHQGQFVNCRFFRNRAYTNRAGASNANLYNCVFDENEGENAIQNCYDTVNCTFGANNRKLDGSATLALALPLGPVVNCLVLGNYGASSDAPLYATNCIFAGSLWTQAYYHFDPTTKACPLAELEVDADFAPVIGRNAAVDAGSTLGFASYPEGAPRTTDVLGGQRVYNGAIDVGAVEADWRPRYAEAMGRDVAVTNATSGVVLEKGVVTIPDGESVAGTWGRDLKGKVLRYTYQAQAEDGTLAGAIGDHAVSVSGPAESETYKAPGLVYDFAFAFAGAGRGTLQGFGTKTSGLQLILR